MRFVSFSTNLLPVPHLGLMRGEEVVDVDLAGRVLGLPVPDQMQELIEHYEHYQTSLQAIIERAGERPFTEVKIFREIGAAHDLQAVTLAAPIVRPRKNIFCLAVNYVAHAQETAEIRQRSAEAPADPVFFTKAPTTVNAPFGSIIIDPEVSTEIDWEVELGVIIGKAGKNISAHEAMNYVFGYTVLNDVTARDLQARHKQFFKGKSLDGSCPMGPWIVTADEIADPHHLAIRLKVNNVIKQDGNTEQMIFSIPQTIEVLSRGMTLEPGDIIATGTPSGVGFSRKPAEFLRPGDLMESEIEGIGVLRNSIVRA
ncbi:fumarylacetoacetate hydrolase family protein [Tengunoibacter tsumagoiensis]|uniref:Gentisate 1,2-dioxygenase n=1 Tax=Tengunoibacter tsumagoiensis TaxID=2014871 RepID=A0A401ZTQ8_9CHLR|nr:fumarylacetoacetate hydrolase family protein [Tengunoibacter tsumagoiensis]GCE10160.1 gentisate 1,2-dioxygenase [Tengunoibacter tsumagoiensis]